MSHHSLSPLPPKITLSLTSTFILCQFLLTLILPPSAQAQSVCPGAHQASFHGVYGVWSPADYPYLASIGINWLIVEIWDADPVEGLEVLNAAEDNNIQIAFVIIQRGEFGDSSFTLSEAEIRFNRFFNYTIPSTNKYTPGKQLKYHPALAANYPYSMNHQVLDDWAANTSKINVLVTSHRQQIYQYNKQVTMRDDGTWVPLLVHYRSAIQMSRYDNHNGDGITRGFAAGEADIALIHDYPNYTHEGDSDPSTDLYQELEAFYIRERDHIKSRDPNTKINMLLGATVGGMMPSSSEMDTWACIIAQAGGADAISWWPWRHGMYPTQLGTQTNGSYMYADQHCSVYQTASYLIPNWLSQNSPTSPSHCPSIVIPTTPPTSEPTSQPTTPPTQPPAACPADINQDGIIDLTDYSILVANFLISPFPNPRADINQDNLVDLTDYSIMVANFLQTCP